MADSKIYYFVDNAGTYIPLDVHDNGTGGFSLTTYGGTTVSGITLTASPLAAADANLTQLITVTTSGIAVQGPDVSNLGGWMLKADPNNSGNVWWMFHGQTKALKGFPMGIGETTFASVSDLNSIDFDSDYNGGKIHASKA